MDPARARKLGDRIAQIVAEMLERRVKDPRLGFVTVTEARVTGDLREATVFYTVYGNAEERAGTAAALASATGLIRSEVGRQTGLRHTPSLAFELDTLPDNARNIEDLVARARAADAKLAAARAGAEPAGDPDPYRVPGERQSAADADAGSAGAGREPGTEVAAAADGDVRAGAGGDGRGPGEGSGSHLGGSSPGAHHGAGYSPS